MQRGSLRFSLFVIAALLLAACGDDDDETPTQATAPPTSTSAATSAGSPPAASSPIHTPTTTTPSASPTQSAALQPCSAASLISAIQTPLPTTPVPPTPTQAGATPAPTATFGPAPSEDRVGYPEGYQENFKLMFVFDRADNRQVRVICGNDVAVSVTPGEPFPYGSVMVMETYRTKRDADGNPVLDENGRFIREALSGIFVMRKEEGFGEAYGEQRSGEWEYVAFRPGPEQEYSTPPDRSNPCAACHVQAGEERDWVFRADLFFDPETANQPPQLGENELNIWAYQFVPATLEIKAGTTLTWVNNDEIEHTVTADASTSSGQATFDSGILAAGDTFSFTFDTPGTYAYVCTIHRGMTGEIEVTN